ncbi:MAG TPA: hypothetical protein VKE51_30460 [Vicinamibacterales bacterium]|nr:hypothetical protein [Vicinamibacterales bacterium]
MRRRIVYSAAAALSACVVGACNSSLTAPDTLSAPSDAVVIEILGMNGARSFSPSPATVPAGRAVVWHNSDFETHHIVLDAGGLDTEDVRPGRFSPPTAPPAKGGYHCTIHPSMTGTLALVEQTPARHDGHDAIAPSATEAR